MKRIQEYVEKIDEEINDAKDYAEKYLYYKALNTNPKWTKYYMQMANEELQHATYIHDMAMEEIAMLDKVYKPTEEMEKSWNTSHIQYVDRVAWIKKMLEM